MQKITPHLWFDTQAKAAAEFYTAAFGNGSTIKNLTTLSNTPSGDTDIVSFALASPSAAGSGEAPYSFMAISAGPLFKFNPSISFILNFDPSQDREAQEHLDALWEKLADGGTVLMPLQEYPFSKHYGWIQDQYGLSWQLIVTNPEGEPRPFITPSLMFTGANYGKAEEATDFYLSVFSASDGKGSKRGQLLRYPAELEPGGTIMFTDFMLDGQWFAAVDSGHEHGFTFNEAISFIVKCDTQAEIDYYWERLSAVPEAEQCGWLKDRYGVSWQIVPRAMDELLTSGDQEKTARVTEAFLKMKKFDIAALERAAA